jgi:hypothetical protein
MTRGPEGGATAQALNAKAAVTPIVKRVRHMVTILLSGRFRWPLNRLPMREEFQTYHITGPESQSSPRIEIHGLI